MASAVAIIDASWSGETLTFVASRAGTQLATGSASIVQLAGGAYKATGTVDLSAAGAGVVDMALVTAAGALAWLDRQYCDAAGLLYDDSAQLAAVPTAVENREEMDSYSTRLSDLVAYAATEAPLIASLYDDWADGGRLELLVDTILADTNELQTDWVNGGRLDNLLDAVNTAVGELQTDLATVDATALTILTRTISPTAAANLEDMFDGTGYVADTAPSSRSQVASIGAGSGSALNFAVTADNTAGPINPGSIPLIFIGTQFGTYQDTWTNLGTFHQIDHNGDAIDLVYRVACAAGRTAVSAEIDLFVSGANDELDVFVYDHVGDAWDNVATVDGTAGATTQNLAITLFEKHTGAVGSSESGNVYLRFATDTQSEPALYIARVSVAAVPATATTGYEMGAVWVDEDNGTSTGTVPGVDATFTNRSTLVANAKAVAGALQMDVIRLTNGNSVTLIAALEGYDLHGNQCSLALGGQNVGDSEFFNFHTVTGTAASTGGRIIFTDCDLGNVTVPGNVSLHGCGLDGTLTLSSVGDAHLVNCYSEVAGFSAPTIDMASLGGAATVSIRRWSGGLNLVNVAVNHEISVDAVSGGTISINGTGGTVAVRGMVVVQDLSGGAVTIDQRQALSLPSGATAIASSTQASDILADTVDIQSRVIDIGNDLGTVDTTVNTILADTNELQTDWADGGRLDLILDARASQASVDAVPTAAENRVEMDANSTKLDLAYDVAAALTEAGAAVLALSMLQIQAGTVDDTAYVPSTTIFETDLNVAAADHFKAKLLVFTTGTLAKQNASVESYELVGGRGRLTVSALTSPPANGDQFILI